MDANFGHYSSFAFHIPPPDTELTNLNWVSGAPVPMQHPVSPTKKGAALRSRHTQREDARTNYGSTDAGAKSVKQSCSQTSIPAECQQDRSCGNTHCCQTASPQHSKRETPRREKSKGVGGCKSKRDKESGTEEPKEKKPNCSYTSLIGLALMASEGGCLPVSEIYTYIEGEFPYFRSAPDGWKNSIRHNLSLNPAFRKVQHSRWQGKKGFYWEVTPERRASVEREVERYLRQEGKLREMDQMDGSAPFPSCLHASIPAMPQAPSTSGGPRPICEFQFCTGTQPYYDIVSSMQRHYPPPLSSIPTLLPPPASSMAYTATTVPCNTCADPPVFPPSTTAMVTLLDTDQSPSQFAGFSDPATSSTNSALRDLFGLQMSSPKHLPCHSTLVYTQPPAHTYVVDSCGILSPHASPCACDAITLSDYSASYRSKRRSTRVRTQALDQLIIPKEHSIASHAEHTAVSECINPSQFYMDSTLLDHRMSLEECFAVGEDVYSNSGVPTDYLGELPLPPSVMGREEERAGVRVKEGGKKGLQRSIEEILEVISETSPSALSNAELGGSGCAPTSVSNRRDKRGWRKRRRISARRTTSKRGPGDARWRDVEVCDTESEANELEKDERKDMLSHVCSDSEQTVRESLFPGGIHATCTVLSAGGFTVEDGLFSPPHSCTDSTVAIPALRREVY